MAKEKAAAAEKELKVAEFKYGVKALEELFETTGITIRSRMRKLEVPKNGSTYGWNTKAEFDAVAKQLKEDMKPKPKRAKEAKPAKVAKVAKVAKANNPAAAGKGKPKAAASVTTLKKKGAKPSATPAPAAEAPTFEASIETAAEAQAA